MLSAEEARKQINDFVWEVIERLKKEEPEKYQEMLKNLKIKEAHHAISRKSIKARKS